MKRFIAIAVILSVSHSMVCNGFALSPPPPPPDLLDQIADLQNMLRHGQQEFEVLVSGKAGHSLSPSAIMVRPSRLGFPTLVVVDVASDDNEAHVIRFDSTDFAVGIGPGETRGAAFIPPSPGSYEFYCDVPGHRARGESGVMYVRPEVICEPNTRYAVVIDSDRTPPLTDLFGVAFEMTSIGGKFQNVREGSIFGGKNSIFFQMIEPHGKEVSVAVTLTNPNPGIAAKKNLVIATFEMTKESEVLVSHVVANDPFGNKRIVLLDVVPAGATTGVAPRGKASMTWGELKRK